MTTTFGLRKAAISFKKPSERVWGYCFYLVGVLAAFVAAAILTASGAQAQTEVPVDATSAASAPASATSATSLVAPRYSARDVERAFGFIDANKDGKISREEASGFRNVAKYFDAADVNKDGALSLEEFGSALNRP